MRMLIAFVASGPLKLTHGSTRSGLGRLISSVRRFPFTWPKKVTFILQSRSSDALPWILKRPNTSEVAARPQLVLPNPAFDKPRAPPPNKRQRIKACVDGTVDTLGHRWILGSESASNLTMRCEICGLYVQQVLLQDRFDQLMQHPCKDQPSVLPASWGIHHSHNMLNLGVYWVCLTCEKLQRPVSEHAAKPLKESCKGPPKKSGHHAKQAHANQKNPNPEARYCTGENSG